MRRLAAILILCAIALPARAFLFRTNPPPVVTLAWEPSTNSDVTSYTLYWGLGSHQYTNTSVWAALPTNNTATITLPARELTYWFAATATDSYGLESDFSNEVSWTPRTPPMPPMFLPITILTVQATVDLLLPWWDDVFEIALSQDQAKQFYRLRIR